MIKIIEKIKDMQSFSKKSVREDKTIGFVPTMGALHEGHLSLVRKAKEECDIVVVSIFVNPTQFGPGEDLEKYPRAFEKDKKLLKKEGADVIFFPNTEEMYPDKFSTFVEIGPISQKLCGISRPSHFRGVTTVVNKLFWAVMPDKAYFGQKDAQQAIILQRMVDDFNIPVTLSVLPTIREDDGLAMSSRNKYLDKNQRKQATCLKKAIDMAQDMIKKGEKSAMSVIEEMALLIEKNGGEIDYISIVRLPDLEDISYIKGDILIAVAIYFEKTRLIDNIIIKNV